jgi:hypothetical protein
MPQTLPTSLIQVSSFTNFLGDAVNGTLPLPWIHRICRSDQLGQCFDLISRDSPLERDGFEPVWGFLDPLAGSRWISKSGAAEVSGA